jgi:hypothetical protein
MQFLFTVAVIRLVPEAGIDTLTVVGVIQELPLGVIHELPLRLFLLH